MNNYYFSLILYSIVTSLHLSHPIFVKIVNFVNSYQGMELSERSGIALGKKCRLITKQYLSELGINLNKLVST